MGGSIGFWRGVSTAQNLIIYEFVGYIHMSMFCPKDVKLLIEDLGELKPSIFCAVPRVLDRVYTGTFNYFLISV